MTSLLYIPLLLVNICLTPSAKVTKENWGYLIIWNYLVWIWVISLVNNLHIQPTHTLISCCQHFFDWILTPTCKCLSVFANSPPPLNPFVGEMICEWSLLSSEWGWGRDGEGEGGGGFFNIYTYCKFPTYICQWQIFAKILTFHRISKSSKSDDCSDRADNLNSKLK